MKAAPKNRLTIGAELESLRQNRVYLVMMSLLLVCALVWVLVTIMEATDKSEVSSKAVKFATPINPNLDLEVFTIAEGKRLLTEAELENFPILRLIKDRGGVYQVIPFDTPKDEVERLTANTRQTTVATPRPSLVPAAPASTSGSTR